MIFFKHLFSSFALVMLFSGCGGGSSDSSNGNGDQSTGGDKPGSKPFTVYDTFKVITPNTLTTLDIKPYVIGNDIRLIDVSAQLESENCPLTPLIGDMSFQLQLSEGQFCSYEYVVKDAASDQKQANFNILASSNTEDVLLKTHSVVEQITADETHYQLNLQELLGRDWPKEYVLNAHGARVYGSAKGSHAELSVVDENTIQVTPSSFDVWNKIDYVLEHKSDSASNMLGSIYVTLNDVGVTPPQITPQEYDYNAHHATKVDTATVLNIDLSSLPNFSISDAVDWQLAMVSSTTASVAPQDSESTANTTFTFSAAEIGHHEVSYIVVNNLGGYSHGLINIEVEARGDARAWNDLHTEFVGLPVTFSAPPLITEVSEFMSAQPLWDEAANNTVAGISATTAKSYCSMLGRVPTDKELENLAKKGLVGAISGFESWPKSYEYLAKASNGVDFKVVDITTGNSSAITVGKNYYLTCIQTDLFAINVTTIQFQADNTEKFIGTIDSEQGANLTARFISDEINEVDAGIVININHAGALTVSGTKAGSFNIEISHEKEGVISQLTTPKLHFIADNETAVLDTVTTDRPADHASNGLPYIVVNGIDTLGIIGSVVDANSNPVEGELFEVNLNQVGLNTNSDALDFFTNVSGEATVYASATADLIPDGSYSSEVTIPLEVNGVSDSITVQLRTEAFLDWVDVQEIETTNRYTKVRIFVRRHDNSVKEATVTIQGGVRGGIIHLIGRGGYTSSFTVPEEGVEMFFSMVPNDLSGNFYLSLAQSPSMPEVQMPQAIRTISCSGIGNSSDTNTTIHDTLLNHDSAYLRRTSSSQQSQLVLPLPEWLTDADMAKVVHIYNNAGNSMVVHQPHPDGNLVAVTIRSGNAGYWYYNGSSWAYLTGLFTPTEIQYNEICL